MHHIRFLLACGALSFAILHSNAAEQAALPTPTAITAEAAKERFVDLFVPFRTNKAALSPDGKYLAYTLREESLLSVVVVEIDNPSKATAKVTVISDDQATPMAGIKDNEKTPAQIRWMGWVTPTRLVVETNRVFPVNMELGYEPPPDTGNGGVLTPDKSSDGDGAPVVRDSKFINILGEIYAFDANGQNARKLLDPRDIKEGLPFSSGKILQLARSPHIVDFAPDDPNSVILQADGIVRPNALRRIERYKLNVLTNKLTSLSEQTIATNQNFLFDRQGKPRISIPSTTRDPFPHLVTYDSGTLLKRWKPLNQLVEGTQRVAFALSPQNYFVERSMPLGFDYNPDLLYFASNVGRDTYGIYGLDLKSGKLSHLSAESATFDMFSPSSGVFPDSGVYSLFGHEDPTGTVQDSASNGNATASNAWENSAKDPAGAEIDSLAGGSLSNAALFARAETQGRAASLLGNIDGSPLIYDRYLRKVVGIRLEAWVRTARWFNPEFQSVQNDLERLFPSCMTKIEEWDSSNQRFLVQVGGVTDPGAYYIYDSAKKKLTQFVTRAPWLDRTKAHENTVFSFSSPKGHTISGVLTFPRVARTVPVPVIVLCSPQPWARVHMDYQPEILAYADMGFAVIQVNTRGSWGFGIKYREAFKDGYEDAQIADISAAVDYLGRAFAINSKRVAVVGTGFGGYLALRSVQLEPKKFRCAIAIDTILDLQGWVAESRWSNTDARPQFIQAFLGGAARLKESPLLNHPETISNPILMLSYRGPGGTLEPSAYIDARKLVRKVSAQEVPAEIFDLTDDYMANLPAAKSEAHRKIEDFLNLYIYNYKVNMGDLKIIKE